MNNTPNLAIAQAPGPLNLFYCYAHKDLTWREQLEKHLSSLVAEGIISPWFDGMLRAGDRWNEVIKQHLDEADIVVLLVSCDFLSSQYIIEVELKRAIERERVGNARVIPVIVRDCVWKTPPLNKLQALPTDAKPVAEWERGGDAAWTDVAKGIREAALSMLEARCLAPGGVVSRERFRASRRQFTGEVYAIEMLEKPVHINRDNSGTVIVTIDRSGVQEYVISNEGKRAKVREYGLEIEEKQIQVAKRDREIQAFLAAGGSELKFDPIKELGMKLRWASGGVLSLVHRAGDAPDKRWVPLFFRDIPPYGWNLALGSAERWFDGNWNVEEDYSIHRELDEPENFILREFIEETMIVDGNPFERLMLPQRRLRITDGHGRRAIPQANRFSDEHRQLRRDKRDLDIREEGGEIEVTPIPTRVKLIVLRDSRKQSETDDVLVCFSLLDLGIEVVKVKQFEITQDDYFLDGEIQPGPEPGSRELVRMPMALMSEAYLRKAFSHTANWQNYTNGLMPSTIVEKPPDEGKGEIILFKFDVARRVQILDSGQATSWEKGRFEAWLNDFKCNFFEGETPSAANPSRLFVPGTAKLLNLYFGAVH